MFNEEQNWEQQENPQSNPSAENQQWTYQQPTNYQTYPYPNYVPPKKKEKKPLTAGKAVALALCCSLIGGILGAGACIYTQDRFFDFQENVSTAYKGDRENTVIETVTVDTGKLMSAAEVYAANVNSTVGITTSVTTNYWGYQTTSAASGSGFVLTDDGYILTNQHVIENSDSITVTFYNGTSLPAELIGYDASNDIAVLKVNAENLQPVILGDSGNTNVGDEVVAIGNPLGELTFSLTQGVVSALDRQVTTSSNTTMNLMQTDCAINSGNSGGALFNLYGEVIGITNAKYSSGTSAEASIDNIGFAIPVNQIKGIVESLIEKGYISKPYIGVRVTDVSEETQRYGFPKGASVYEITKDSPAESAGLKVNDIIVAVDTKEITGSSDLVSVIKNCQVGQIITLTVYRNSSYIELTMTIGEQIQSATEQQQQQQQQQLPSDYGNFFNPFG